ncbi:MAG: zinc ribbon domain-containing protein [Pseudomonadota bacterium]
MPRMSVVRWAAPLITLLAAIISGTLFGVQLLVLTLAGAALLLVIWLLWSSVQALAGESELTFEEAFSLGTRSAEEEQKRAVLRALKDLEYERSVGKISEDDYHEYSARYRAEAKRLIQSLDENLAEGRRQVEEELARRLNKKVAKAKPDDLPAAETSTGQTAQNGEHSGPLQSPTATRICAACWVKNEPDARFCKACGKSMTEAEESQS